MILLRGMIVMVTIVMVGDRGLGGLGITRTRRYAVIAQLLWKLWAVLNCTNKKLCMTKHYN